MKDNSRTIPGEPAIKVQFELGIQLTQPARFVAARLFGNFLQSVASGAVSAPHK